MALKTISRLTRLSGLCWQCDKALRGTGMVEPWSKSVLYGDFYYLTKGTLNVHCLRCGPTTVDHRGHCITDCKLRHKRVPILKAWWKKVKHGWYKRVEY
jgi:hypothetical protein